MLFWRVFVLPAAVSFGFGSFDLYNMDKDKILDMIHLFNDINEEMDSCREWNQQTTSPPVFSLHNRQLMGQMNSQKFKWWLNSRKFWHSKYFPDLHNVNGTAEKVIQGLPSACIQ